MEGLEAGLATNPGLEFVGPINTGIEPGQMFNAIQNAMQANPDAIAIASVDCCSIVGAAKWAEDGRPGRGHRHRRHRCPQQTLNYIEDGTITFSISQDPVGQVFTAISQLKAFVTEGTPPADDADAAAPGDPGERIDGHAGRLTLAMTPIEDDRP